MTKEEFIQGVENIVKYKGDVRQYIEDHFDKLEFPFSLNDSFEGTVNSSNIRDYWKYGDTVRAQFHNLCNIELIGSEPLPFINCVFRRDQQYGSK